MSHQSPGSEEEAPARPESPRGGGNSDERIPTWMLGLIPLVVAGVMLVLALHV